MKNRYLIVNVSPDYLSGKGKFVAGSKAPNDVTEILREEGFSIIPIVRNSRHKFWGVIVAILKIWHKTRKLPHNTTILVQYPMFNIRAFVWVAPLFKRFNSVILIHDIRTYCQPFNVKYRNKELAVLNCFNTVIAHSENMKNRLAADGVNKRIAVLGAFDYLLADGMNSQFAPNSIMFAGALGKSEFLKDLHKLNIGTMKIYLYGASKPEITYNNNIVYKGRFSPEDISEIEAEWGLLWDGNSIESCSGCHGDYLELIAPHKFSLYLACGLKIVCWEQSAMAELVRKRGLGITISRLDEIEEKIKCLADEEKCKIEKNVKEMMQEIRHGFMLRSVINEIEA